MKQDFTLSNPLGTKPVGKLLFQYALPSIIAMSASSIYNIVDSIFIGHGVGPMAIAGLAITFPLMNISAAFGALLGIGAGALTSIRMGEKNQKQAMMILGNMIKLDVLIGLLITLIGIVFLKPILTFFGASEQTLPYAYEYMLVIMSGNVITHSFMGLNDVLRASGYPRKAMGAMLLAVLVNCILDALLIFVFKWGIMGAAVATVVAQAVALSWEVAHFMNKKHFVHFRRECFKFDKGIIRDIVAIGLSPFFLNVCSCMIIVLINTGLMRYGGDIYVGAYGIINRICFLIQMSVAGFTQGMQPIAGFNLGARKYNRVTQVLKYTICCGTGVTVIGFVMGTCLPNQIAMLFTRDEQLIGITRHGMRIAMCMFPVIGFQMVTTSFFQAVRQAKKAIFLSTTRQMLILIPLLIVLPRFFGTDGVWMSMPISDFLASLLAAVLLYLQFKSFGEKHSLQQKSAVGEPV